MSRPDSTLSLVRTLEAIYAQRQTAAAMAVASKVSTVVPPQAGSGGAALRSDRGLEKGRFGGIANTMLRSHFASKPAGFSPWGVCADSVAYELGSPSFFPI